MWKKSIVLIAIATMCLAQGCRSLCPWYSPGEEEYTAMYTSTPIKIDGNLDEAVWKKARSLKFITHTDYDVPVSDTKAKILWDDQYLYVGFEAADKDLYGYMKNRDASTCREDVLEFFFNTTPKKTPYYNFEINSLGTVYDAFSVNYNFAGGVPRWSKWNCEGLKVATQVRGSMNDCRDVDEGWSLEVAIPFKSLETIKGKTPMSGDVWKFHVARYDYSIYLPNEIGREISSCVPFDGSFHIQDTWIPLIFRK